MGQTAVLRGIFVFILASIVWGIGLSASVVAVDAGGQVQSYAADRQYDYGTIMRLSGDATNRATVATQAEMQNMFGVAIDPNLLPLRVTNESLQNETFIAVSGTYNVLVNTQGGHIKAGDYLTLSSVNGMAMKAGYDEPTVLGRAVRDFDGKGVTFGTKTLTDPDTQVTKSVTIGSVPVTIEVQNNPNELSTKTNLPDFLERAGQAIAEKEVSPLRMYLSLAITAVSLIAAIAVLYAGVRSGVISIGRNPMSKKSIYKALIQTILTSLLILIIGLFAVYLLLKL